MTVFRWIMGGTSALLVLGWLVIFVIALLRDDDTLSLLARRLRQWLTMLLLAWFNLEIWGRVVWTLVTW